MSSDDLLQRCGKLFFSQIRPLFFFLFITLPVLGAAFFLFLAQAKLEELEARFAKAARKEKISFERKAKRERFIQRYSQANPYFLDQQIESLPLLQREKERLEALLHHPAFPDSRDLKGRLQFIQENRLFFTEENIRTATHLKETDEKQRHPVQMDENDLQKVLSLIEDVPVGAHLPAPARPQLIVQEMRIRKTETPLHTEVFEVEMDLLKREFNKS